MCPDQQSYTSKPLKPDNWNDLIQLFGSHGAYGGCWCTFFRQSRKEYNLNRGEKNQQLLKSVVENGQPVGLLAYAGDRPVGWCAFSPRENYLSLERSRMYKRVDNQPVWSLTCFFTASDFRRKGVTVFLIREAIDYVRQNGGRIMEAYPTVPENASIPDDEGYTGILQVFTRLGFQVIDDKDGSHPIVRYQIV